MRGKTNLLRKKQRAFSWRCSQSALEVGRGGEIFLEGVLSGDHNWCQCQPQECEVGQASQCEMKGHEPSVSLESIDAVNLITGSENQSLKSTIRGMGQDNCFPLRY